MENIILSFNVIAPLFFLMVIGYAIANYTDLADKDLLKKQIPLYLKYFCPVCCLKIYIRATSGSRCRAGFVFAAGSLLLLFVLLCLIVPKVVKKENQQGVVIQGIFRSNYVIFGVAVVENMYGSANTVTAAILSAVLVPMYNFLAVIALSFFGGKRERDFKKVLVGILKNPLIIASVLGIIASLLGFKLPKAADTTLNDLAKLATPIAFLILGGDFDFSKVRGNLKIAGGVVAVKMVILPLIFIPMVVAMGYRNSDLLAALLAYQTPVAVSSYIMAQQAGADEQLAGQLVVFSSAVSIFTLFVTIFILRQMGLLN
ncbi:AEC family transporter [Blautia sp. RD014234]|nr:AEC family transporter [Blautia parvula]